MDDAMVLKKRGYTLGISLGEGSYAKVKSAYSDRLKTNVAVKIINRRKAPADFLEKFLPREMEILAVLNHRNVVKTFEIFETSDGKVYMIMELGVQGDLLEFIKFRGALPEDFCRKLFRQLALAIKYIHDLDIVHRDLKCENLLLDKDFNIKVSDFGFCRRCHLEDANIVFSKTFCGSAAYAAPEVLQGIPYNPKVYDIWSMGVVLYIMLCGSMPYDDSNIKKMLKIQKEHRVDFPRTKNLAPECKDLIYRMLNPEVSRRIEIDEILDHAWLRGPRPKTQEAARKQADGPSTSRGYSRNGARGESRAENPSLGKKDAEPDAPEDAGAECEADAPDAPGKRACKAPRDATDPEPPPCHRRKSSAHAKQTAHMHNEEHHR